MTKDVLFALLRYELQDKPLSDEIKQAITPELLPSLFSLSKKHDLCHLVAEALIKNDLLPKTNEFYKQFFRQHQLAIYRYEQLHYDLTEVCRVLEEEKIEHIPLKGSVIRAYYPQPWMRTSCDIDILVHPTDLERAIKALVSNLLFQIDGDHYHDMSLFSQSGVHLELHYELIEDQDSVASKAVLQNFWQESEPVEGCVYQRRSWDETFYFYHMAHTAKHFLYGGCGIRPFIDFWILDHCISFDKEKRNDLLKKGNLFKFANTVHRLVDVWFEDAPHDDLTKEMELYVLEGGVYGNIENKVAVETVKKGGNVRFFFSKVFLPYFALAHTYPILKKHPILTPFYQVRRWFGILFRKGGISKGSKKSLQMNASLTTEKKQRTFRGT